MDRRSFGQKLLATVAALCTLPTVPKLFASPVPEMPEKDEHWYWDMQEPQMTVYFRIDVESSHIEVRKFEGDKAKFEHWVKRQLEYVKSVKWPAGFIIKGVSLDGTMKVVERLKLSV